MALRLDDVVVFGEINCTKKNATFGVIVVRDDDNPYSIQLTGDAGPTLLGRRFEFTAPGYVLPTEEEMAARPFKEAEDVMARIQVGPTGEMNYHLVKTLPEGVPIEELLHSGKPIDFKWKPCLTLEWYSQNGRVCMQLLNPQITVIEGPPLDPPTSPFLNEDGSEVESTGFSVTIVGQSEEGEGYAQQVDVTRREAAESEESLEDYLEAENRRVEANMRGEEEAEPDTHGEFLLNYHETEYVGSVLQPQRLPRPDEVSEEQALLNVKSILAELAMFGVAIHLCHHASMKEAYKYIIEEIVNKERFHPKARKGGWTMNFDFGESCPKCEAEIMEKYGQTTDDDCQQPESSEEGPPS